MTPSSSFSTSSRIDSIIEPYHVICTWAGRYNPYPCIVGTPLEGVVPHLHMYILYCTYDIATTMLGYLQIPRPISKFNGSPGSPRLSMLTYGSSSIRIGSCHHCGKISQVKRWPVLDWLPSYFLQAISWKPSRFSFHHVNLHYGVCIMLFSRLLKELKDHRACLLPFTLIKVFEKASM